MVLDGRYSEYADGADEISFNNLKYMSVRFWNYLTDLHNIIIEYESYPENYRLHKFVPVKKSKIIREFKNFRPVGVSCCLANITEKIMAKQMAFQIEMHSILRKRQYGFRPTFSIGSLISDLRSYVSNREKKYFAVISTDLSNAFFRPIRK